MRDDPPHQPAFGEADLSNCERELIHLPGSIQPHGALLVFSPDGRRIVQASRNTDQVLGLPVEELLSGGIGRLTGELAARLTARIREGVGPVPVPLRGALDGDGGERDFEVLVHRNPAGALLVELEPVDPAVSAALARGLPERLASAIGDLGDTTSVAELAEAVVALYREVAGYDRVMVYRFDADGHGEVVAEGKEDHLEPYLGLHYPASDIPRRARELYLRNRIRMLVDVDYRPVPLVPRLHPPTGEELDMSMSWLRSMSPLHIQYLKNMGVTATLVASLVREGELWGLVACHHYSPRRLTHAVRTACDLIAEVAASRISVLENFSRVRSEVLIRRMEGQLIQSIALHGDWRPALLDDARRLLKPLGATGAVLAFDGELHPVGEVPATPKLRALVARLASLPPDGGVLHSSCAARDLPGLELPADTAAGFLAVPLSSGGGEFLIWLRGEQVQEVRWAGNPNKPVLVGDDPRDLSPRRSFAVWTEQVRGTARAWSPADLLTARAMGASLRDVVLQVRSMSLLLTERRLHELKTAVQRADQGVLISDGDGRILFVNEAFSSLFSLPHRHLSELDDLAPLFRKPWRVREMVRAVTEERRNWRGELEVEDGGEEGIPVAVRADRVEIPGGEGALGHIVLVTNLKEREETSAARERLRRAILNAQDPAAMTELVPGENTPAIRSLVQAVLANASVAVAEVAEGGAGAAVIPVLDGLEAATLRAAELTRQIAAHAAEAEGKVVEGD